MIIESEEYKKWLAENGLEENSFPLPFNSNLRLGITRLDGSLWRIYSENTKEATDD